MSNYPYGKEIKNEKDLKGLVTNLIFWHNNYTKESIIQETKKYLAHSSVKIKDEDLDKMVLEVLKVFEDCGNIEFRDGAYRQLDPKGKNI